MDTGENNFQSSEEPDLFDKISSECTDWFWKNTGHLVFDINFKNSDVVYHYTNLESAINIIENNELWSTSINFLNDSNEMVCAQNVMRNHTSTEFYKENFPERYSLAQQLQRFDFPPSFFHHFVTSFCSSGDQLSQWRGYGSGVAIGFMATELNGVFKNSNLRKVIYNPEDQVTVIDNLLKSVSDYIRSHNINAEDAHNYLIEYARSLFDLMSAKMKNKSFEEEREWRLITSFPIQDNITENLQFRARGRYVIPYIKLKSEEKLPITEIIISPNSPQQNIVAIKMICAKAKIDCTIRQSRIPFID